MADAIMGYVSDANKTAYYVPSMEGNIYDNKARRLDHKLRDIGQTIGTGVLSSTDLKVSAKATPSMYIQVPTGTCFAPDGSCFTPEPNYFITVVPANATNPRKDIVYVNSNGDIAYLVGSASTTPTAPLLPSGGVLLAEIYVGKGVTSITNSNITDKRNIIQSNIDLADIINKFGIINIRVLGAKGNANYYNNTTKKWYEDQAFTKEAQDDSQYVKQAIIMAQIGGTIYAPKGNYLCSVNATWSGTDPDFIYCGDTTYSPKNFIFTGDGSSTKFIAKYGSGYALNFEYGTNIAGDPVTLRFWHRMIFENFNVDAYGEAYGIKLTSCSSVRINNVQVLNPSSPDAYDYNSAGIWLRGCGMFRLSNYQFNGKDVSNLTCAIKITENSSDSVIDKCDICFGSTGIYIQESGEIKITENVIYGNSKACIRTVAMNTNVTGLYINENELEPYTGASAISLTSADDRTNEWATLYAQIKNNSFYMSGDDKRDGIIGKCYYSTIEGNNFRPILGTGIGKSSVCIYLSYCGYTTIENNIITRLNAPSIGIQVGDGLRNVIKSNKVYDMDDYNNVKFIVINSGNNFLIQNNTNFSAATNPIFIETSVVLPNTHIDNNHTVGASLSLTKDSYTNVFNVNYNQIRLGDFYLWIDAVGKLRIKLGMPTSDTDGMVVGTQTA